MERRKKMTKSIIGDSLKSLMLTHPFEKITIKMITDEAGIIRPTFYNYFCDKYEVLQWIFEDNVIEKVRDMFEQKMYSEGIKLMFVAMKNDGLFYKKAFEVTGQNAFEDILKDNIKELFRTELGVEPIGGNPILTHELVADYYALLLAMFLKSWLTGDMQKNSIEELMDAYEYLITHNIHDFLYMEK